MNRNLSSSSLKGQTRVNDCGTTERRKISVFRRGDTLKCSRFTQSIGNSHFSVVDFFIISTYRYIRSSARFIPPRCVQLWHRVFIVIGSGREANNIRVSTVSHYEAFRWKHLREFQHNKRGAQKGERERGTLLKYPQSSHRQTMLCVVKCLLIRS